MTDTLAAIVILPALLALVIVLECAHAGCSFLLNLYRSARERRPSLPDGETSSTPTN